MDHDSQSELFIRYDDATICYATKFLVRTGPEDVLLDLSPGILFDGEAQVVLPIQNRIALPWAAVERLAHVLNQAVKEKKCLIPVPSFVSKASSSKTSDCV